MEVLGALVVLSAALCAVIYKESVTGGLVGLSISYALTVSGKCEKIENMPIKHEHVLVFYIFVTIHSSFVMSSTQFSIHVITCTNIVHDRDAGDEAIRDCPRPTEITLNDTADTKLQKYSKHIPNVGMNGTQQWPSRSKFQ